MTLFRLRLRRAVEKNWPELRTLLGGSAPSFVYGARDVRELPVFAYHRVDAGLRADLELLARGGYRTVGAAELESFGAGDWEADGRSVVLTFDDGHVSLVETAVPLLASYGFRALAFVVAGVVPETSTERRAGWSELRDAVRMGVLEVGSHSLFHHQVSISPRIRDFVAPWTDTDFSANVPVPRVSGDEEVPIGTPIFRGAPRYAVVPAFLPDPLVKERCVEFARREGPALFRRPDWRSRLRQVAGEVSGRHETPGEAEFSVERDIAESLRIVAERCPNDAEDHMCYPWFIGSGRTDRLAVRAGVRVLHKGIDARHRRAADGVPASLRRLPPDFLRRLPGPGRRKLSDLAIGRLRTIAGGPA